MRKMSWGSAAAIRLFYTMWQIYIFFVAAWSFSYSVVMTIRPDVWKKKYFLIVFKLHLKKNSIPKAVSGQRCPRPAWEACDLGWGGAGQRPRRGMKSSRTQGESVHPSVRPSVCLPSVQDALLFKLSLTNMEKWQKAVYGQWYPCPFR